MTSTKQPKSILHYPQLDTVLMVERFIKEHTAKSSKKENSGNHYQKNDEVTFSSRVNIPS